MVISAQTVAFRRIYMDISGDVDAALEAAAKQAGKSKKAFVEELIKAEVSRIQKAEQKKKH